MLNSFIVERKVKLEEGGGVIDGVKWGKEEGKGGLGRVQYTGTHYSIAL